MSDAMPKKWINTKCSQCEHFWAYPVGNEHGEDWTWECESNDLDDDPDELVGADEDCNGFFPAPIQ